MSILMQFNLINGSIFADIQRSRVCEYYIVYIIEKKLVSG